MMRENKSQLSAVAMHSARGALRVVSSWVCSYDGGGDESRKSHRFDVEVDAHLEFAPILARCELRRGGRAVGSVAGDERGDAATEQGRRNETRRAGRQTGAGHGRKMRSPTLIRSSFVLHHSFCASEFGPLLNVRLDSRHRHPDRDSEDEDEQPADESASVLTNKGRRKQDRNTMAAEDASDSCRLTSAAVATVTVSVAAASRFC